MNLKDAKIIVTGGSSGIGKSIAEELVKAGAKVLITARHKERLQKTAEETGSEYLQFDISDLDSISDKASKAIDMLGGVDVLINNAGVGEFAEFGTITAEKFYKVFNTNVFGLTLLTQRIVEVFKKQDYGHIVNISSTASLKGYAHGSIYAASKFALRGLSQCWQAELRKHNVRVIQVNPSEVTTAFRSANGEERPNEPNKLRPLEIAHTVKATLEMDNRGFIPEVTVFATNPWK